MLDDARHGGQSGRERRRVADGAAHVGEDPAVGAGRPSVADGRVPERAQGRLVPEGQQLDRDRRRQRRHELVVADDKVSPNPALVDSYPDVYLSTGLVARITRVRRPLRKSRTLSR